MTLRLAWRTADVEGTALRFASAVGGGVERSPSRAAGTVGAPVVRLVGAEVAVVPAEAGSDRLSLDEVDPSPDDERAALRGQPRLLGLGWATVDPGRAIAEVAERLGLDPAAFRPADDDDWLGATAHAARLGSLVVAVLEPSTEGRLAASLARSGEGPCALYVTSLASGPAKATPVGTACLVMADRPWGPFVLTLRRSPGRPR